MAGKPWLISHISALFSTDPIIRSFCLVGSQRWHTALSSHFQVAVCRDTSPGLAGARHNDSLVSVGKVSGRDGSMSWTAAASA